MTILIQNSRYLKSNKYKEIFKTFIESIEDFDEPHPVGYKTYFISVFDHWLSEEEFVQAPITCFSHILLHKEKNNLSIIENAFTNYYIFESKFIKLYSYLYTMNQLLFYDEDKKKFYKYKNFKDFLYVCEKNIREESFVDIYIPKLQCVIRGSWDLTHIVYYKSQNKCNEILDYARKADLYVLK